MSRLMQYLRALPENRRLLLLWVDGLVDGVLVGLALGFLLWGMTGCAAPTEPCIISASVPANGTPQPVIVRAGCTTEITATYDTTPRKGN